MDNDNHKSYNKIQDNTDNRRRNKSTNNIRYEPDEISNPQFIQREVTEYRPPHMLKSSNNIPVRDQRINLEINNRIIIPQLDHIQFRNYTPLEPVIAHNPNSNHHQINNLVTSNDIVRYGTKNTEPRQLYSNYNSNEDNNVQNNYQSLGKNFLFSYDSNNIVHNLETSPKRTEPAKAVSEVQDEVERVEIDLFATESNIDNSVSKHSSIQLFPVTEKCEFKMEDVPYQSRTNDYPVNYNNVTRSNNDIKANYNTNINSGLLSIEESHFNEYTSERNQKQNQSTQINQYVNNLNNYQSNKSEQNAGTKQVNQSEMDSHVNNGTLLNMSKFTNFVGISQQNSKKIIPKFMPNNYYANIVNKPVEKVVDKTNIENISQRNMMNSYLSNDNRVLNKYHSGRTIETANNCTNLNMRVSEEAEVKEQESVENVPKVNELVIGEINLFDDDTYDDVMPDDKVMPNNNVNTGLSAVDQFKKMNYFDSETIEQRPNHDKILIVDNNSFHNDSKKDRNLITPLEEEKVELDISDLIKPNYLMKRYNQLKDNKFTKQLSKSFSKPNINSNGHKQVPNTSVAKASSKRNSSLGNASEILFNKDKKQPQKKMANIKTNNISKLNKKDIKAKRLTKSSNQVISNSKADSSPNANINLKPSNKSEELLYKQSSQDVTTLNTIESKDLISGETEKVMSNILTEGDDKKTAAVKNNNYDYSKFSLDIVHTNHSSGSKSGSNFDKFQDMNELLSNTIRMHSI